MPPTLPPLDVGACTDVGQVRLENQDAHALFPYGAAGPDGPALFLVADGMGGEADGARASRIAAERFSATFFAGSGGLASDLRAAVQAANRAVREATEYGQRMGTTCTALVLAPTPDGAEALLAHVGDSQAYRIENGEADAQLLTRDHTVAEEMHASGILSAEEAARHPRRHTLTRSLGIAPEVEPDVLPLGPAAAGTRFVLCSDGLAEVSPAEIAAAARRYDATEAAEWLVALANSRGGRDNITVVVVHVMNG